MNATPINKELTEDEFEEYLNEMYGTVDVCGMTFDSGAILRELDPTAFRCGQADYESELEPVEWECGECGAIYDNEDDAEDCCSDDESEG